MPADIQIQAKKYSSIRYHISIISLLYSLVILFSVQVSGLSLLFKIMAIGVSVNRFLYIALYLFYFGAIYYTMNFPLKFYSGFVLEHKFNLSTQNLKSWIVDQAKSLVISSIIFLILMETLYFILDKFENWWWLIVSVIFIFFSIILAKIVPIVIIPIFFKYKKIENRELKERILKLADKAKIKVLDVFEIDSSKKTNKANAGLAGLGRTKRVILADTLKDRYSADEIEVILAHEFAHYKLKHILKNLFINSACIIILFYLIFTFSDQILKIFKLSSLSDIESFPILIIFMSLFELVITPISNFISRSFEKDADLLALRLTNLKGAFISTMEKLSTQNLSDRSPSFLIKMFFFDHPSIDERIETAKNFPERVRFI